MLEADSQDIGDDLTKRLLAQGQAHYNAERFDEALAVFAQLTEAAPASSQAYLNLGNACFQLDELEQAEHHWLKAIELDPTEASAYLNLGNLYFKRENPHGAVRYWEMFRKLSKTHANVCLNLGVAYDQLHDVEKAFEAYQAFLGLSPTSAEAGKLHSRFDTARKAFGNNLIIAEKALAAGELSYAREIYEKTLPLYPGTARIYKPYATVLYKLHDFEAALKYYLKTHAHDPEDVSVVINIGVICEKLGRPVDAMWAYAQARRMKSDDHARVADRYEAVLFQHKAKIPAYFEDVNALIRAAKYDEAKRRLQHLLDLARDVPEANALKPQILDAMERVDEAQDPVLKAAKTFYNRGVDAQDAGRFDQALRFFGRYLQVKPTGKRADEVRDRLEAMRQMMGAVVQSLLDVDEKP